MTDGSPSAARATHYSGAELEAMGVARNYYRWILRASAPYIGRVVLEHGSGIGTFARCLLEHGVERLVAVEPARNLVSALRDRTAPAAERVGIIVSTLEEVAERPFTPPVDTVVSVNVLEHIEDDRGALRAMWRVLRPGGHVVIFVPALPRLYGSLDRAFAHVRRYGRDELQGKLGDAGFRVVESRYMNFAGIAPWWVSGHLLRARTLNRASTLFYDRCVIPLISRLEGWCAPPVGQNLLMVGEKPPVC